MHSIYQQSPVHACIFNDSLLRRRRNTRMNMMKRMKRRKKLQRG